MQNNAICAEYCISVIRAVMQEHPVPPMPDGLMIEEIFAFSKKHSMEALIFHGVSELDVDETSEVYAYWQNRAQMLLTQSMVQLANRDELFAVMEEAGVDLLPVKGCWLKEAYPDIDYRQMSDLDMLIRREDRSKVKEILLGMGYAEESGEVASYHDGYEKKPYMAIEMHLQLLASDDPHEPYYRDVWSRAQRVEGYTHLYRLSPEDEYIYYFLHLKKHLDEAGCGIRLILDSVVFRQAYPQMDRVYLENEFDRLGISGLVGQIERLSDCWFVTGEALPQELTKLGEEILTAGNYGTLETAFHSRIERFREKYKHPALAIFMYWCSRFFRPMSEMKNDYPILEKLPVLLPVFWGYRIAKKIVTKPRALLYHFKEIYKGGTKHGER